LAIYHLSISIVSRGKGKSAVAAAAYRAGELIKNEYDGIVHDYTRKGGVVHTGILLPAQAPEEFSNRALLWNAVEKIEKAENAQLARDVEFSLPQELTREQNISLAHEFVKRTFVDSGMCADVCINEKEGGKTAVKDALYNDYYKLKDDIAKIEKIQRSVKEILHSDEPERTPTRARAQGVRL
jgi:ATP-dependent exoDNAse (exonuclease V) alpha subunit